VQPGLRVPTWDRKVLGVTVKHTSWNKAWLKVLQAVVFFVFLFLFAQPVRATPDLKWPFDPGPTWGIWQGYNTAAIGGTHGLLVYDKYSFDLTQDGAGQFGSAGKNVLASVSGYVVWQDWNKAPVDDFGCIAIRLPGSQVIGGSTFYFFLMSCHTVFSQDWRYQNISQGTLLGTVASAGQKHNGNVAHTHITLYRTTSSTGMGTRIGLPFSDNSGQGGYRIDGYNFPKNDAIYNQYRNTSGLRSTNYTACPPYPYPGQDSSRWWLFQQAYDRWGGREALGCATGPTYWWNGGGGWLVRQNFKTDKMKRKGSISKGGD